VFIATQQSRLLLCFLVCLSLSSCTQSNAALQTIYDDDRRVAVLPKTEKLGHYSSAIALLTKVSQVKSRTTDETVLRPIPAADVLGLCPDEPFQDQFILGDCTGFAIGKNLLVTARHCMPTPESCRDRVIVFGYDKPMNNRFAARDVFACKNVVSSLAKDRGDLALIELDREFENDRTTLRMAADRLLTQQIKNSEVFLLGHPFGMSLIASPLESSMNEIDRNIVSARADAAQGMSGAPVLNVLTGEVSGVLLGGGLDLEWDLARSCNRSFRCTGENCKGEHFASLHALQRLLKFDEGGSLSMRKDVRQ